MFTIPPAPRPPASSPPRPLNVPPKHGKVCEYEWGSPIQNHTFLARGDFDVVICSDLLYDPVGWKPLLASLRQLVARAKDGGESTVYLAHRTRNAQEHGFFAMLQEGSQGDADAGGTDERGVSSWSCRGLSGGGQQQEPQQQQQQGKETCVGGGRSEEEKEGDGVGGSSVRGSVGGVREREGLLWRRGCFPDVALYELSPIRAGSARLI